MNDNKINEIIERAIKIGIREHNLDYADDQEDGVNVRIIGKHIVEETLKEIKKEL